VVGAGLNAWRIQVSGRSFSAQGVASLPPARRRLDGLASQCPGRHRDGQHAACSYLAGIGSGFRATRPRGAARRL